MPTTYDRTRPLETGDSAWMRKHISDQDVRTFAEISGDHNPIHLDDDYAATSVFGRRIAHGTLSVALISAVLGMLLPGPGAIYLAQNTSFRAPVFIDDEIIARVSVVKYRPDKRIATLKTDVYNQRDELVLEGEAVIIAPPDRKSVV